MTAHELQENINEKRIPLRGGASNLTAGLQYVRDVMFTPSTGARSLAPDMLILVTATTPINEDRFKVGKIYSTSSSHICGITVIVIIYYITVFRVIKRKCLA